MHRPELTLSQILDWADTYHERTGRWPVRASGRIAGSLGETWNAVDIALQRRGRGISVPTSLAKLLAERRGVRNRASLPRFTLRQILAWADVHHRRNCKWPTHLSGPIPGSRGESWRAVDKALRNGGRGLRGHSSLARLLAAERGVRNHQGLPRLCLSRVLAWADAHHRRTGAWPTAKSGRVHEAPGERWSRINTALIDGLRGLPGGSSLARLFAQRRGVRNRMALPLLTIPRILAWADAYHRQIGEWPRPESGPIQGSNGETWAAVERALQRGARGLAGGSSLYQLLRAHNLRRSRFQEGRGTLAKSGVPRG